MKKTMLFIVALLFSVSVSAATLQISTSGSSNATQNIGFNNGNLVTASGLAAENGNNWNSDFNVVSDVDTSVKIEWSFNPESNVQAAELMVSGMGINETYNGLGDFITTLFFLAGESYFISFNDISSSALTYDLSVQAVPVPAALFLFAPALLGLLGLRRKATLAA